MPAKVAKHADGPNSPLMKLFGVIATRDEAKVHRLLDAAPELARQALVIGASRQIATEYFFTEIGHYAYAGDTALHFAAAAHSRAMVNELLKRGADIQARNRRGAEPLHYAVDGNPATTSKSTDQEITVECLIGAGADANATDKSGVGPLHRAVRTRSTGAVRALLANGADPHRKNGNGSTPLHLAVQNTGRGGSGSATAVAQQREIILLLQQYGARPTDTDAAGKTVLEKASSDWMLALLEAG